ncbi:hypothetical protein [Streptomyces sp. NRRL F-5123]|uniref:hypothetical protein n=1 Tax=Streptomyces sp. NRRL F-5123 TaxID=1463856 RepID=UPI0007C52B0A|nr:hypothetical protein [Streptomyces sp. NRRL F-5123]
MDVQQRNVWVEEPARRPRMADPVRAAAVRAVLISAVALVQGMIDVLLAVGRSWLSAPVLLTTVLTSVVATWAVLDVWVTRQVWNQRNGVLSSPSSAARARRAERRGTRREGRTAAAPPSSGAGGRQRPHIPRHLGV